jgi:phosphohistidine phosphatase SixA
MTNAEDTSRQRQRQRTRGRAAVQLLLLVLSSCALLASSELVEANPEDAVRRLTAGGHVLLLRHALAPGMGDPAEFRVEDCATQRNLDERGRAQARDIGVWLRSRGVSAAAVFSSQWCRCLETATLLGIGPVTERPALNSFYELRQNREPNLSALRAFLRTRPAQGPPTVLVTHQVTISALTGVGVSSGEGVLIELDGNDRYTIRARLRFKD